MVPIRRITRKKKKLPYKKRRFNITRRKYRSTKDVGLSVRRMVSGTTPLTYSTVATTNFWKYNTVSLDSIMLNYSSGSTICSLTNLAEYQQLFDQFKLSAYKITLRPKYVNYNMSQQNATTGTTPYNIPYVCILKDAESAPSISGGWSQTTLNALLEQGGKIYRADRPVSIYMKPKVAEQYGSGAVRYITPRYTNLGTGSNAGTQMAHQGFHMFFFNGTWDTASVSQQAWDVYATLYLKFKNPK